MTVLYKLGLMVLVGSVLGFLMEKIADLLGDGVKETEHFGGDAKAGKRQ